MSNNLHLQTKSRSSFKWSVFGEVVSRTIQPIVTILLARILAPSAFGIVAIASIFISVAQLIQEFGLGKSLIQTTTNVEEYRNNAFWLNFVISLIVYGLLFYLSENIAGFFSSPRSSAVIRVLGIQIIINSLFASHYAFAQRQFAFRSIFVIRSLAAVFPGITAILLANYGFGVWALVYGTLLSSFLQLIMYWSKGNWYPRFSFNFFVFLNMVKFSKWIFLEGILSWGINWGDSIALGVINNTDDLGKYRLGSTIVAYLSNVIFTPIIPVSLSYFSRVQDDLHSFMKSFKTLNKLIVSISFPLGVGLFLLSSPIVQLIFGSKWKGLEIVIGLIGIKLGLGWVVGINSTIYTALGKPYINIKILVIVSLISIPLYFLGAQFGLLIFLIVRLIASIIDNLIHIIFAKKYLRLDYSYYFNQLQIPLISTLLMTTIFYFFDFIINVNDIISLILSFFLLLFSYLGAYYIFDRNYLIWGMKFILKSIKSSKEQGS